MTGFRFFVAAERTNEDTAFIVNTGKPQYYSALEGTFPSQRRATLFFVRGDAQLTPSQNFFVRYGYMLEEASCEGCGGPAAAFSSVGGGGHSRQERDSLIWGHTWVISTRMLNEIRAQGPNMMFNAQLAPPGTPIWTGAQGDFSAERYQYTTAVYNFPSLTWGSSADMFNKTNQTDIRDDFLFTTSDHGLKFGFAYLNIPSYESGFLDTVNAYRAGLGLKPIPASNIESNRYKSLNVRASKSFPLGGDRRLELIAQVFNVLGTDNLAASGGVAAGGVAPGWSLNALSDSFGRILQAYNRQQAELAVRFTF